MARLTDVGDTIGHQDDAAGAVGVQGVEAPVKPRVEVRPVVGDDGRHLAAVVQHLVLGSRDKPGSEFTAAAVEQDDAETIFRAQLSEGAFNPVGKRGVLPLHGPGDIENEHPVPALVDPLEVVAGGDHQHEGTALLARRFVGHEVDTSGQTGRVAPIDDQIGIEREHRRRATAHGERADGRGALLFRRRGGRRPALEANPPLTAGQLLDPGLRVIRHANRVHRIGRSDEQIKSEVAGDLLVGRPEGQLRLVDTTFFQGIEIPTDPRVDPGRLQVDQTQAGLLSGSHGRHPHLEALVALLLRDPRVPTRRLLLFVDAASLLPLQYLARHRLAVDPEGELSHGALVGHGKGVERLQVPAVRIEKNLFDPGDGVAVLDDHLDLVVLEFQRRQRAVAGPQQPGGLRGRPGCQKQHRQKQVPELFEELLKPHVRPLVLIEHRLIYDPSRNRISLQPGKGQLLNAVHFLPFKNPPKAG